MHGKTQKGSQKLGRNNEVLKYHIYDVISYTPLNVIIRCVQKLFFLWLKPGTIWSSTSLNDQALPVKRPDADLDQSALRIFCWDGAGICAGWNLT